MIFYDGCGLWGELELGPPVPLRSNVVLISGRNRTVSWRKHLVPRGFMAVLSVLKDTFDEGQIPDRFPGHLVCLEVSPNHLHLGGYNRPWSTLYGFEEKRFRLA